MPELERLRCLRIVASREALDAAIWRDDQIVMRLAPDDVLVIGPVDVIDVPDEHAIAEVDTGWAGLWLDRSAAAGVLSAQCEWPLPEERPAFAQGMIAHLPVKLWLEEDRTLFVLPAAFAEDFEERIA